MTIHTNVQRPKVWDKTYELAGLTREGDELFADASARLERPSLSIIVPTRNEAGNVEKLVTSLEQALPNIALEVIFVDDSTDDTPWVIQEVSQRFPFDITVIARPPERRNGLGMAVVEGMQVARSEWVCVMDGDLQHPPEVIPQLLDQARSGGSDLVMGSRLVKGGGTDGLSFGRTVISHTLALATRATFPQQLRKLSDPLTGFFLFRRDAVDPDQLQPDGFKILLEILVRYPELRVAEIPFEFGNRHAGESKASTKEVVRLMRHMFKLRMLSLQHLGRFLAVGASGLIVNNVLMALFVELLGLHYLTSAIFATQGSTIWNFSGTELWVFKDRPQQQGHLWRRLVGFLLLSNVMLVIRGPMLALFVSWLGMHYLAANLLSITIMTLLRYAVADRLIWRNGKGEKMKAQKEHKYNIHDLVRVRSMQRLPELTYFQTDEVLENVDLEVRIDKDVAAYKRADSICYDEPLGQYGFSIVINRSDTYTEVVATPTIARSPHVLYTNVVESLLRWHFVRKGYTLMHGACLEFNGEGMFITAKTDTGKTTTILHTIRNNADTAHFLSDDMTIFGQDGRVFSYPKPLTISQHTVQAIGGAPLSFKERLFLKVQSRLHSRSGRTFGMMLCEKGFPGATLNAIVQMVVPPPKFMVDRLIPEARYADTAKLTNIVLIERGPEQEAAIPEQDKTDILLANADDAYGFPPYPMLAAELSDWQGEDMHHTERALVEGAIKGLPGVQLSSNGYDWYKRLPKLVNGHARVSEHSSEKVAQQSSTPEQITARPNSTPVSAD